jgi:hypothetical protein
MTDTKNYASDRPDGMWGFCKKPYKAAEKKKRRIEVRSFAEIHACPKRNHSPKEVERIKNNYGIIWDVMTDKVKELCKLQLVTRDGYIRMNLERDFGIILETKT